MTDIWRLEQFNRGQGSLCLQVSMTKSTSRLEKRKTWWSLYQRGNRAFRGESWRGCVLSASLRKSLV